MKHFSTFNIQATDLKKLENFTSRDGFNRLDVSEFNAMMAHFEAYEVYKNLIPILTDNHSNYWCLYVGGVLKGMVCYLNHAEVSLEPKFKGIYELLQTIEKHPKAYDYHDLEPDVFDFPMLSNAKDFDNRKKIITTMLTELNQLTDQDRKQQMAFAIMQLTSKDEIDAIIYPLLDHKDMYIQERAIELLVIHNYTPAKAKLIELAKTASPNGKSAAKRVLQLFG